jgi:hypothetical protein
MSQPAPGRIGGPLREASGPAPTRPDLDGLQRRIRQTREDLGQTVAALTAKTRVKARARSKAAEVADRARCSAVMTRLRESYRVGRARSTTSPLVVVAGSVAGLVGLVATAVLVHRGLRSRSAHGLRSRSAHGLRHGRR